jgi:hypothetical protein
MQGRICLRSDWPVGAQSPEMPIADVVRDGIGNTALRGIDHLSGALPRQWY